jgi:hypothetical protein
MAQFANMMNPVAAMLGPDVAKKQYELQQNQRYADILMQQALMDQPQGQMVSGHYVPPSPVQGLAQLLKAYVGRRASDLVPEKQAALAAAQQQQIQNMFGVGGGTTQPLARDMALAGGAMQGDVGPTNTNAQRMSGVQTGQGSAMPIPAGMDRRTAMMQYMLNPQAYATALGTHSSPTEIQKIAAASGFAPGSPQYQALMQGNLFKQNYIAPTTLAPGAGLVPAGANAPVFNQPKDGMRIDAQTGATSLLPGYLQSTGAIAHNEAYLKGLGGAQTTPATRFNPFTGRTEATTQAANMGLPTQGMGGQQSGGQQGNNQPVVVGENPVVVKAGEELNKQWITGQFEPAIAAGEAAKGAMDNVRLLKSIDLTTGFGTDAQKTAANVLASFGVKDAAKFATNAQIFESKVYESLVDTLSKQKGPQTDKDFANLQKTYANLKNTPQANQFLLDVVEAKAMQDQRKAGYFQKAASMPELRSNLSAITNEWGKVSGSMFDLPIQGKDGSTYTLAQKYGIK